MRAPRCLPLPRCIVNIRESFDGVFVLRDVHDGHPGHLPDSPLEILIARGHNVAFVVGHTIHETVVGVGACVRAGQALDAGVLRDAQCHAILHSQLLQLRHYTIRDDRHTLRQHAIEHGFEQVELVDDAEIEEVGVDEDLVGGTQGGVVLEEQRCGGFGTDGQTTQIREETYVQDNRMNTAWSGE